MISISDGSGRHWMQGLSNDGHCLFYAALLRWALDEIMEFYR